MIDFIEKIIDEMPIFDSVIQEILLLLNDLNTSSNNLEIIIRKDPILSLKVLKLANSAFYSPIKPITNIAHAVRYIGYDTLRSIVYSIALQSMVRNSKKSKETKLALSHLQRKSLINAVISMMIGEMYKSKNNMLFTSGDFYIFGLFHDIGLLALAYFDWNKLYEPIYEGVKHGIPLIQAEGNYSHSIIGEKILRKWEIPAIYHEFVALHHRKKIMEGDKLFIPYKITEIADYFSGKLGFDDFYIKDYDIDLTLTKLNLDKSLFYDENNTLKPIRDYANKFMSYLT